ncbi:hypothetical protein [Aliikangiella coralliicola]|uniref:Uncharacterized protein n=1 Tax=Aliikangiella coralliicola TaxID=2592383 RepID=A0A545UC49_9GAMM|nr:hypothetical protein [Aliikangiella coralliicola]TQV87051.1 hypothetical protein FLL46_14695 [Aliikangiella coralliicola]
MKKTMLVLFTSCFAYGISAETNTEVKAETKSNISRCFDAETSIDFRSLGNDDYQAVIQHKGVNQKVKANLVTQDKMLSFFKSEDKSKSALKVMREKKNHYKIEFKVNNQSISKSLICEQYKDKQD